MRSTVSQAVSTWEFKGGLFILAFACSEALNTLGRSLLDFPPDTGTGRK